MKERDKTFKMKRRGIQKTSEPQITRNITNKRNAVPVSTNLL